MDALARQLDAFMEGLLERADPAIAEVLRQGAPVAAGRGLAVGELAPPFTLPDQNGRPISLASLLARGPVVLTFFRGGWCPFCTISLRALAVTLPELRRLGAELVAISPQTADNAQETAERNGLDFSLLTDLGNVVARRYGVAWDLGPEARAAYARLGHKVPELNGSPDWTLPVPAGFVIAPDGRVTYAHMDPRPTRRLEPGAAVAAVRAMKLEVTPAPAIR